MTHLKDLVVNGTLRVLGTLLGHLGGKLTIGDKVYDGSSNVTIL